VLTLLVAGAEFAEYVIQAAFGKEKPPTIQAYVFLGAEAGGEAVKKEIGADLDYFSVNIELGVRRHELVHGRRELTSFSRAGLKRSFPLVTSTSTRRPCSLLP